MLQDFLLKTEVSKIVLTGAQHTVSLPYVHSFVVHPVPTLTPFHLKYIPTSSLFFLQTLFLSLSLSVSLSPSLMLTKADWVYKHHDRCVCVYAWTWGQGLKN